MARDPRIASAVRRARRMMRWTLDGSPFWEGHDVHVGHHTLDEPPAMALPWQTRSHRREARRASKCLNPMVL